MHAGKVPLGMKLNLTCCAADLRHRNPTEFSLFSTVFEDTALWVLQDFSKQRTSFSKALRQLQTAEIRSLATS